MNYENQTLGAITTQEKSFPFMEYILPSDYDKALRALQKILEARWGTTVLSLLNPFSPSWRYIGVGADLIKKFLDRYILYARKIHDFIRVTSFTKFKSGMMGDYPELQDDQMNEWLNAMIQGSDSGMIPDSILKPYNYVPEEAPIGTLLQKGASTVIQPSINKLLLYAVIGGTAYALIVYGVPRLATRRRMY